MNLDVFFTPRSVAVVGASRTPGKVGHDVLADLLASGFKGEIVYNNNRFVGVKRRVLDVSRMRDELGWVAPTSLEDGLERTVRWYESELERETMV